MHKFWRSDLYARLILIETILILFFFALCIIPATSAFAATVNLAWNASSGSNVAGYKMYYGTSSRTYSYNVKVGNYTSCSLSGLQEGKKYYFAATAYNSSNVESSYSTEISYTVPTSATSGTSSTGTTSGTSSTGTTSGTSSTGTTSGTSSSSGTTGSTTSIIIDNGGSGTSSSGSWPVSGGSNSYGTKSVYSKSVGATYTFQAARSGSQDVNLWWTYWDSRYTNVPVKIYNGSTLLKTVYVNQKQNGGKWNSLGTYSFSTQAKVVIESRSSSNTTCADAVRFAPAGSSSSSSSTSTSTSDTSGSSGCTLNAKFKTTPMKVGAAYYTDRNYTIKGGVPDFMIGRTLIRTVNDELSNASSSGYVRFSNPVNWWVYVLFDSRSSSIPNWLKGWELRSEKITTSLSSQPYLKVYRKQFDAGQCVDLGGNYGSGSSIETRSNYVVVYGK